MKSMEDIQAPRNGSSFSYWGDLGQFAVRPQLPNVALRYRTEPPHGDFLYSVEVDSKVLANTAGIRLFWGRNLVLSPCGRFIGITEYSERKGSYSIIDLAALTEWRNHGYFELCSLAYPVLKIRPWIAGRGNVTYGDELTIDLDGADRWEPLSFFKGVDPGHMLWPPVRG